MIIETFGNFYMSDPMSLRVAEKKCFDLIRDSIAKESHYQSNLIVNLTWFWWTEEEFTKKFLDWVNQHSIPDSTKIYFTVFIDESKNFRDSAFFTYLSSLGHHISFYGFGENWYTFFPNYLNRYENNQITLSPNFEYKYLCYNRKPSPHRIELVSSLRDKNILDSGWVTFQQGYFPSIDKLTGITDDDLFPESDLIEYFQPASPEFSRPDDVKSLGNLDIWNNSYCVVVSESGIDDPWHVTEKTWKPILGMRPFLFNGNPNALAILNILEIYTPGELFGEPKLNDCDISVTTEFLKELCTKSTTQLYQLWESQLPMLTHNRNQFEFLAREFITPVINLDI